jgi:hypothetical protein
MAKFNEEKTIAAILFLAQKRGKINLYALLKTIYYADKQHFQDWGRTITGDIYCRLPYGPVPSKAYDMLKSVRGDGFWDRDLAGFFKLEGNTIRPLRSPNLDSLSDTDIKALEKSFAERGNKGFAALKREAHNDPAFKRSDEYLMTEEDLAEDDPLLLQHIMEVQQNERFLKALRFLPPRDEEEADR